jgi:hypothetical protein
MIDHITLIQIPYIIGGDSTPSLVGGPGVDSINDVVQVQMTGFYKVGNHLITEYDLIYNTTVNQNRHDFFVLMAQGLQLSFNQRGQPGHADRLFKH